MYSSIIKGMFIKNTQISFRRNTSGASISKFLNSSFSTKSRIVLKKTYSNSLTKLSNNSLYNFGTKNFSDNNSSKNSEDITTTLYLNEQEAYFLNEHDRMIVQLTSNVVPMSALPKFMRELLELCFMLSKYKEYTKGWKFVAKFFSENLKNFPNEDLEFYVGIFSLTKYIGETPEFWKSVGTEVLSRSLGKDLTMQLVNHFTGSESMDAEFWGEMIKKIEGLELKEYQDLIQLAGNLGIVNYTSSDSIWETILSKVENQEVVVGKDFPVTFLLTAANALRKNISRDSPFYEKVRVYFINNFKSIPAEYLPNFCSEFVKLNPPSTNDLVKLIVQSLPGINNATQYAKFEFNKVILNWCGEFPELLDALNKEKLGGFSVPTVDLVREFGDLQRDLKGYKAGDIDKIKSIIDKFWDKNAQRMGFNTAFAQNQHLYGGYNYNAINTIGKSIKEDSA